MKLTPSDAVRMLREATLASPLPETEAHVLGQVRREASIAAAPEVFDVEGLAAFLRVEVEDVRRCLHEIPFFEVAGKVRFRRSSVERWIDEKEQAMRARARATRIRVVAG